MKRRSDGDKETNVFYIKLGDFYCDGYIFFCLASDNGHMAIGIHVHYLQAISCPIQRRSNNELDFSFSFCAVQDSLTLSLSLIAEIRKMSRMRSIL
jgi:hypothetical protein